MGDVKSHLAFFFWQDSAGGAEENIEKVVNLELVFGYHLKPGNGPKVSWERWIGWFDYLYRHYPEGPVSSGHKKIICCENLLESADETSRWLTVLHQ